MATAPVRTVQNREGKRNFQTFPINAIYPGENPIKRRKKTLETGSFPLDLFLLFPRSLCLAWYGLQHGPRSVSLVSPSFTKPAFPPPKKKKRKENQCAPLNAWAQKTYSILSFTHTQYRVHAAAAQAQRESATERQKRRSGRLMSRGICHGRRRRRKGEKRSLDGGAIGVGEKCCRELQ